MLLLHSRLSLVLDLDNIGNADILESIEERLLTEREKIMSGDYNMEDLQDYLKEKLSEFN